MATKTSNYEFNKPKQNDFYDVDVQNENWDKVDEELSEFDDSGVTEDIKSFPDFLSKFVTGNKVAITLRNLKAGLQFVLHAGQIVNNCVTDNTGLPLSAAQGKVLKDLIDTTNNNLSNAGIPTVKKITDLYAIKKSGFYCYDAGASNAPMSSRGGMIVANYLSDSWISLTVVPYALSKIYTNTKYNNMWVGWAESATKDDLPIIGKFTNKKNKDIIKIGSVVKSRSVVCVFPRYNTLTTVRCIYPSLEISAGEDQFQLFAWDTNTQNDSTSTNLEGYYIVMPMLSK